MARRLHGTTATTQTNSVNCEAAAPHPSLRALANSLPLVDVAGCHKRRMLPGARGSDFLQSDKQGALKLCSLKLTQEIPQRIRAVSKDGQHQPHIQWHDWVGQSAKLQQ